MLDFHYYCVLWIPFAKWREWTQASKAKQITIQRPSGTGPALIIYSIGLLYFTLQPNIEAYMDGPSNPLIGMGGMPEEIIHKIIEGMREESRNSCLLFPNTPQVGQMCELPAPNSPFAALASH